MLSSSNSTSKQTIPSHRLPIRKNKVGGQPNNNWGLDINQIN